MKRHGAALHKEDSHPYGRLLLMAGLSFVAMYALMYGMVDRVANIYLNLNQFYMAGLMTAPMVLIELVLMRAMYRDKRRTLIAAAASLLALGVFWVLLRQQIGITDRQFLRSMIPHHGGAILMCEEAPIRDPGIQELCRRILASQLAEIAEMRAKLAELAR